jgi:hypothetical protein
MKEQTQVNKEIKERKLFYYVLVVTIINIVLWFIAGSTNTTYSGQDTGQSLLSKLVVLYGGVIIGGFILGAFVNLIPFKGLSFGQKYIRSSLLSILGLSVLLLIFIIGSIIFF